MMLFLLDGHLKLAVLDPENAFHPPVDCKPVLSSWDPGSCAGDSAQVLQEPDTRAVYAMSCTGR